MKSLLAILTLAFSFLLLSPASSAMVDVFEFNNEVDRKRYQSFIDEMRCPKCQNQSLSGSDSPIAMDLRREIYFMIEDGKSDKEIVDFMVERYGEYILYRPRLTLATALLWALPVILLIGGIILLLVIVRRRRSQGLAVADQSLSKEEQARLSGLLSSNSTRPTSTDKHQEKQ